MIKKLAIRSVSNSLDRTKELTEKPLLTIRRGFFICNFWTDLPYSNMVNLSDRQFLGIRTQITWLSLSIFHYAGDPILNILHYNIQYGK